jgi:hypothetical protein
MLIDQHGPLRAYVRSWGLRDNQTVSHYVQFTQQAFRHSVGEDSVTSYAVLLVIYLHVRLSRRRHWCGELTTEQTFIFISSLNHCTPNY